MNSSAYMSGLALYSVQAVRASLVEKCANLQVHMVRKVYTVIRHLPGRSASLRLETLAFALRFFFLPAILGPTYSWT